MNEKELMQKRISNRRYTERPVEADVLQEIEALVKKYNEEAGLSMRVVTGDPAAFEGKAAAMFRGVRNYIALIGRTDDPERQEKEGYFGEKMVLALTGMGLGTCWAASSFDKDAASIQVADGEVLDLAIAFGYAESKLSLQEKIMRRVLGKNAKSKKELADVEADTPAWVNEGLDAVMKAPTTKNTFPFHFSYRDNALSVRTDGGNERVMVDLGIAKLHFEIGAGGGKWAMGTPAAFQRDG